MTFPPAAAPTTLIERYRLAPMRVLEAREMVDLAHPVGKSKRFLRLQLPDGVTYQTGDHLALLPRNHDALVERLRDRFGLDLDSQFTLAAGRRGVPVGDTLPLRDLLTNYVELLFQPTQKMVEALAEHTPPGSEHDSLHTLATLTREGFRTQVVDLGRSLLNLLEEHPTCALPFEQFLAFARPLLLRSYSISSSPLASPHEADLMVSLLREPHLTGQGTFSGVATTFLLDIHADDVLYARVIPCQPSFRLPEDTSIPVLLVSAGTGLAPFRAAATDRVLQPGGPMLLFFGCRHPDVDFLHRDELEAADAAGAISLRTAFSRAPVEGVHYVQDRILKDGDEVWALLEQGAHVRVCGDGQHMAPDVRAAFRRLFREKTGGTEVDAAAWLRGLVVADRYVEDVWMG